MTSPQETPEQIVTRATARARAVREAQQAEAARLTAEREAEARGESARGPGEVAGP